MNVTYNLSEADCQQAALCGSQTLCIRTDFMSLYVSVDSNGDHVILLKTDEQNVLLHEGCHRFGTTDLTAPEHPWVFRIESPEPLLCQAKNHAYVSSGGVAVHFGDDHGDIPFIALSMVCGETYLFRLPDGPDTAAWTEHNSAPVLATVGEPVPGPKVETESEADRERELQAILKII